MRKIYFIAADKWGWSNAETDSTDFYMLEYMLEDLEEKIKEENKQMKKQEQEYQKSSASKTPKPPKASSTDYGGFKVPKVSIPKMPTPKF